VFLKVIVVRNWRLEWVELTMKFALGFDFRGLERLLM
jgi:hypothetical protein